MAGGSDRGGGEAKIIRTGILNARHDDLIQNLKNAFAKPDSTKGVNHGMMRGFLKNAFDLIETTSNNQIHDEIRNQFKNISIEELKNDVDKVDFVNSDICKDGKGNIKSASALMDKPGSDICVNFEAILNEFGPHFYDSDLVALMVHEIIHNYGLLDADHKIAIAIALAFEQSVKQDNREMKSSLTNIADGYSNSF